MTLPVCSNCGQWQHGGDCLHECVLRGFATAAAPEEPLLSARDDISLRVEGLSIVLIRPNSDGAKEWFDEHLAPDCQRHGPWYAIDRRYIGTILAAANADGLEVGA